jgi:adenylate kinase
MIILMGVAGAGKSMQGRMLADEHGYAWISTGELFRVLVTGERRQQMLEGKLLSDDEVISLVDQTLNNMVDTKAEFVLDGFPRTKVQADWLLKQVKNGRLDLTGIINLAANRDVVKQRLLARGRQDDTEEAIARRFEEYENTTLPIVDYFQAAGSPVYNIEADQTPKAVHQQILNAINNK